MARKPYPYLSIGFLRSYLITMRPYLLFVSGAAGLVGLAFIPVQPVWRIVLAFIPLFLSYGMGQGITDSLYHRRGHEEVHTGVSGVWKKMEVDMSIYERFHQVAQRYPRKTALTRKVEGRFQGITYQGLSDAVDAVAAEMRKLGIRKGDSVGIFSYNRPEWAITDLAALKLGAVVVPIYHTLPPSVVKYIVADSKVKLLFCEDAKLLSQINKTLPQMPSVKNVVLFEHSKAKGRFLRFADLTGSTLRTDAAQVSPEDVATVVYTSGTTGNPKGAILTHNNIVTNATSAIEVVHGNSHDVVVSYLPLCHMLERTCGYYSVLFVGGTIAYAGNITTVAEDVKAIRPTVMLVVPRVVEKVHQEVTRRVMEGSRLGLMLVSAAIRNLNEYANLKFRKERIPLGLRVKYSLYNAIVGSKFRKIAGGRLRLIISGGAALDKKVAKSFYILGFNILEGYGLTETSPVVCVSRPEDNILGTVGKPVKDVEVKIGANSEILVRGPNVMKGYLNQPQKTAEVIDADGWFHTGDQGRFDRHGNLIITGRIKEIIVNSYGENIAPTPIEERISHSAYINQVMLYGDKKKYLVALMVPDRKSIEKYAQEHGIPFKDYQAVLETEVIKELFRDEIRKATAELVSYLRVKRFVLLAEQFSIDNGLLTPTLKLRREKITHKYAQLIENLYQKPNNIYSGRKAS